jgi:hypothetical protein
MPGTAGGHFNDEIVPACVQMGWGKIELPRVTMARIDRLQQFTVQPDFGEVIHAQRQ